MEDILLSCRCVEVDFRSVPEPLFTHCGNPASRADECKESTSQNMGLGHSSKSR